MLYHIQDHLATLYLSITDTDLRLAISWGQVKLKHYQELIGEKDIYLFAAGMFL